MSSSTAIKDEEPPLKKNKPATEPTSILSLPDDLLLSCFARVSRLYYPFLPLVSKRFHARITSTELYRTRSLLGRTESCLYVCLKFSPDSNPRWFTLYRRPNTTLTNDTRKKKKKKKEASAYALAPISILNFPQAHSTSVVAVGSTIYNIASSLDQSPSSSVSILDCRTHTWHEAPNMQVERNCPAANFYDGKIYVAGGSEEFDSSNWMEVFDLKTQAWEFVSNPLVEKCSKIVCKSAVIKEKIYMARKEDILAYMPKEDRWEGVETLNYLNLGWYWHHYCVIDNILYSYNNSDGIEWYDTNVGYWVSLKGVKRLSKLDVSGFVKLVDYGGKMAVFWEDKSVPSSRDNMIWCAVIALKKRNSEEIRGKIEWSDPVLRVPKSFEFVSALSARV